MLSGPRRRAHREHLFAAVQDATLAASIHNSQPWRFVLSPDRVQVWLDTGHGPSIVDPAGRWALQSVGAAMANLELGVRCRLERSVEWLLTDADGSGAPLAVLTLRTDREAPSTADTTLHAAIARRRTNRWPSAGPAGLATLQAVAAAARGSTLTEVVEVLLPDAEQSGALVALTAAVDRDWRNDVAYLAEVERWAARGDGLGIPVDSRGPADSAGHLPARDFAAGVSGLNVAPPATQFEELPELMVLRTLGDSAQDWLCAGAAVQRLMLAATAAGLTVGVLGQLVERDPSRARAAAILDSDPLATVQQVLRLGRADPDRQLPATPRRPVSRVATWQA